MSVVILSGHSVDLVVIMFGVLRIRDFRLLWAGGTVSSLGTWLLTIAIPAHILEVTGSLRDTGLAVAAEYLPLVLLGPVAGVLSDRCDRRRLMVTANLACAASVAVMLAGLAPGRYWLLYLALIGENAGIAVYLPALQARTPAVVGTGRMLSAANSLTSLSGGAVRLVGGPLGGILLVLLGPRWLIGADALSYVLCAAAMYRTSAAGSVADSDAAASAAGGQAGRPGWRAGARRAGRDLAYGLRTLRGQPAARGLLPVRAAFVAANAALSALLIAFGVERLGGSEHTGFLLSGLGIGYLAGAPVTRILLDRAQPRLLLCGTLGATGIAFYSLFSSSSVGEALPAAVAVGAFGSMTLVVSSTTLQRAVANAVLGRVGAAFMTVESAATLLGAVAGPFLAQAAGLTGAAAAASLVTLGAAVLALATVPRVVTGATGTGATGADPAPAPASRP